MVAGVMASVGASVGSEGNGGNDGDGGESSGSPGKGGRGNVIGSLEGSGKRSLRLYCCSSPKRVKVMMLLLLLLPLMYSI